MFIATAKEQIFSIRVIIQSNTDKNFNISRNDATFYTIIFA